MVSAHLIYLNIFSLSPVNLAIQEPCNKDNVFETIFYCCFGECNTLLVNGAK